MVKVQANVLDVIGGGLRALTVVGVASLFSLVGGTPAQAGYAGTPITFNWGLDTAISGANSIQSVLDAALVAADVTTSTGAYVTATVTGSGTTGVNGVIADNTYNADNNVVGTVNGKNVTPYTLATETGGTFLQNNSEGSPASNSITITFSAPVAITSISFDYEIFPNVNCQSTNTCSTPADITVTDMYDYTSGRHTDSGTSGVFFQRYAVAPGTPGPGAVGGPTITDTATIGADGNCPSNPGTSDCGGIGSTTVPTTGAAPDYVTDHSPTSGTTTAETAPQLLGTSGIVNLPSAVAGQTGITSLTFNDWPATIAITNLVLNPKKVPEPGSLALVVSGLVAMGFLRRKRLICRS